VVLFAAFRPQAHVAETFMTRTPPFERTGNVNLFVLECFDLSIPDGLKKHPWGLSAGEHEKQKRAGGRKRLFCLMADLRSIKMRAKA
jgi:hypothetical protein